MTEDQLAIRDLIGAAASGGRGRRSAWAPARWSSGSPRIGLRLALVLGLVTLLATAAALAIGSLSTRRDPSLVVVPSPLPSSTALSGGGGRLLVYAPGSGTLQVILSDGGRLLPDVGVMSGCPHLVAGMDAVILDHPRFTYVYRIVPFEGQTWSAFTASIAHHGSVAGGGYSERWSPDYRRILQVAYGDGIDVVSIQDSHQATEAWYPVPGVVGVGWAADGRRLAVAVDVGTDREIRTLDTESGVWRTVGRVSGGAGHAFTSGDSYAEPVWGAGEATISVQVNGLPGNGVATLDVASGGISTLVTTKQRSESSPDGTRRFVWDTVAGWLVDATDGSTIAVLGPTVAGSPSWSPDGSHFAYMAADGLVVMRSDGRDRQTVPLRNGAFAWSPDGTTLAIAAPTAFGGATVDLVPVSDLTSPTRTATLPDLGMAVYAGNWPPPRPCLEWQAPANP